MLHSVFSRANTIFTFYTTVLGFVVVFIAFSSYLFPFSPLGSLKPHEIQLRNINQSPHRSLDLSRLTFDLNADLRDAFHWNTKQLFVWVTAEYETPKYSRNEIVIWDYIVQDKDSANLHFSNLPLKYPLYDRKAELRGTNVSLKLRYALCPYSGFLWTTETANATAMFAMPTQYT